MSESERLSTLIADIYDTAVDASSWPDVMAKLCAFVPGCASNLFSHDALYSIAQVHYSCGDDPHYVRLYLDKYIKMNPLFPAIAFDEVGRIGVQSDIISFDEFHQTRFYQEWVRPQGYVDCLYSVLDKSETGCAMITVRRGSSEGLVDDEACRRMRLIVPHLQRAVLISRALEHNQAATTGLIELLDLMSAGIFLIDGRGRIAYANRAGDAMVSENDAVARRGDGLSVLDQSAHQALLAAASTVQEGSGESAEGIAVPIDGRSGRHYVAHVLPLTSGLRQRIGKAYAAVVAVFIRKAVVNWASPAEIIAKRYKLTPGEIRVLLGVAEEQGAANLAVTLGLSKETVRTHLKRIFQKTGVRRQADLVKLVAEFASAKP